MTRSTSLPLLFLAALFLVHCDGSTTSATDASGGSAGSASTAGTAGTGGTAGTSGTAGTGGTAGGGGSGTTFACGETTDMPQDCQVGVELCKVQDSAGPTVASCIPIPATCPPAEDLCMCADLMPGCDLGDGPGAFTCTNLDGNYFVSCPG